MINLIKRIFETKENKVARLNSERIDRDRENEVAEMWKFAIGLPVKFIGGRYYKKTGIITKIIRDIYVGSGIDTIGLEIDFSRMYVKLDNSNEIVEIRNEFDNLVLN